MPAGLYPLTRARRKTFSIKFSKLPFEFREVFEPGCSVWLLSDLKYTTNICEVKLVFAIKLRSWGCFERYTYHEAHSATKTGRKEMAVLIF